MTLFNFSYEVHSPFDYQNVPLPGLVQHYVLWIPESLVMKNKMTELDGFFPRTIGSCHLSAGAELARDGGVFLVRVASVIWVVLISFISVVRA